MGSFKTLVCAVGKRSLLTAAGAMFLALSSGCSGTVGLGYGYRVYDPYYGDYHVWGPEDNAVYLGWENENHYPHRDFRRLSPDRRRAFFEYQHHGAGRPPERR